MSEKKTLVENSDHGKALAEPFLATLHELVRTYQAFSSYSGSHIRKIGLTQPQFDVIAVLGQHSSMSMTRLGQETLVTKGTLTGIIDRLEEKGLVKREVPPNNRRSFLVTLTEEGKKMFAQAFPSHVAHLASRFESLDELELVAIQSSFQRLQYVFQD